MSDVGAPVESATVERAPDHHSARGLTVAMIGLVLLIVGIGLATMAIVDEAERSGPIVRCQRVGRGSVQCYSVYGGTSLTGPSPDAVYATLARDAAASRRGRMVRGATGGTLIVAGVVAMIAGAVRGRR